MSEKDENVVSMKEELSATKVTKRGGGQASGGDQGQPAEFITTEQTSEVVITIHEEAIRASRRGEKLKKIWEMAEEVQKQSAKPKIQRVPIMLRDHKNFCKWYEPRVVALGPYHHGKEKYEQAEKVKLQLTANFLKDSDQITNAETLFKKVEDKIRDLRECYDEEATKDYDDEALAWMLFVDGCSTLEFMYKYKKLEDFKIKIDQVTFVEQDMFLLENQLPFQLLELLMISSNKLEELKVTMKEFVKMYGLGRYYREITTTPNAEIEATHLLDLLRTTMVARSPSQSTYRGSSGWSHSLPNVQQLHEAGIHFRLSAYNTTSAISFTSRFRCCGFLYLPTIKVDDSTGPKFMNMLAYERCPDFQNNFEVTSYVGLLGSLIGHPDDVKHLRKKGILQNFLGTDEEVAQLFKEIATGLVPNDAIYRNVRLHIGAHYKTKWKTLIGQFFHDYFSSPWTFPALIGVLLGLGFGGIQTWSAVFSDPSPCDAVCKYLKTHPG